MGGYCFVIGPIGEEETDTRKQADKLLKHIIKYVLGEKPFGFEVHRADEIAEPGMITHQIIERLDESDLVVADLTNLNANVFYELALRHMVEKPIIHLIQVDQRIPFDTSDLRTIHYDLTNLDLVEDTRGQLAAHAEAAMKKGDKSSNPIMAALRALEMKRSGGEVESALGQLLQDVSEIKQELRATAPKIPVWAGILPKIPPSTAESRRATAEALRAVGNLAEHMPACAICGNLIWGQYDVRSSDSRPIHPGGNCPQPGFPSSTTSGPSSTG